MEQIQEEIKRKKQKVELDLTPRQLKVLESELTKPRKATGKQTVEAVAKKLGIGRSTYYADLKKAGNIQDWRDRQVSRLKKLDTVAFAGLLVNLEKGNYDAIRDWYLKFAHLYTDKIEVSSVHGISDEELVEKARQAILTAIAQREVKSKELRAKNKVLDESRELTGERVDELEVAGEDRVNLDDDELTAVAQRTQGELTRISQRSDKPDSNGGGIA